MAAHAFKAPITAPLAYTQLVQHRSSEQLAERDRRAIRVIGEQATCLSRLVDTLLDVSRLQLDRRPLDLCHLVEQMVDDRRGAVPAHRIVVVCRDGPELLGDELRLMQLLHNLIDHAVTYSPNGGIVRGRGSRHGRSGAGSRGRPRKCWVR